MFTETITIDAWRSVFDGGTGEADLHVYVAFRTKGHVGGGDAEVRFRLSLKHAEVHVICDQAGVLEVKKSSIRFRDTVKTVKYHKTIERKKKLAGDASLSSSLRSADVAAKVGVGTSSTKTELFEHSEDVPVLEVTPWKIDRGYAFKIAPWSDDVCLEGRPWDANVPLMKIRDTKIERGRGESPEPRVEIHCLREDLVIEDIEFVAGRFPLWSHLTKRKKIAVEQFLKEELAWSGLYNEEISRSDARIIMSDATPTIDS